MIQKNCLLSVRLYLQMWGTDEPLDVDTFPDRHPEIDFRELRSNAVLALNKVLDDKSELNELWAENEEDYPSWRQGIEKLIQRLNR